MDEARSAAEAVAIILKRGDWSGGNLRYTGDIPFSTPAADADSILAALDAAGWAVVRKVALETAATKLAISDYESDREHADELRVMLAAAPK